MQVSACKRALDLAVGLPLFVLTLPLILVLAAAVRLDSPGPAFFLQRRRGRGMKPFTIVKFRSLRHGAPDPRARYEMEALDPRITRVGAFLRRTSLDELPQLFNVLGGTMSLVGPRPLVEWESQAAVRTHPERYRVKPGLTGWSQIRVRNAASFSERLDLDVEYVRRIGLRLDLWILFATPRCLLRRDAIYSARPPAEGIGVAPIEP